MCWSAYLFLACSSSRFGSSLKVSICATWKISRRIELELLAVLGLPLLGFVLLALFGAKRNAPELNVAISFATLIAAALLVLRVERHGPILVWREQFFVDAFNV